LDAGSTEQYSGSAEQYSRFAGTILARRELHQYPVSLTGDNDRTHRKLLSARPPPRAAYFFGEQIMDKDRIEGSEKGIIGKVKEVAGKVLGDTKLQTEGTAEPMGRGHQGSPCR
jgi:hypothetical protein